MIPLFCLFPFKALANLFLFLFDNLDLAEVEVVGHGALQDDDSDDQAELQDSVFDIVTAGQGSSITDDQTGEGPCQGGADGVGEHVDGNSDGKDVFVAGEQLNLNKTGL